MALLNNYFTKYEDDLGIVSYLPVIPDWSAEAATGKLRAYNGAEVTTAEGVAAYSRNFERFGKGDAGARAGADEGIVAAGSIFDAAAVGQCLFGVDFPRGEWTTGFFNEAAVYHVDEWTFFWRMEVYAGISSWVPYLVRNPEEPDRTKWILHKVNNLHTHHKNLAYQRALPDGPVIKASTLPHSQQFETEANNGVWADRWNAQTVEFRARIEQGELPLPLHFLSSCSLLLPLESSGQQTHDDSAFYTHQVPRHPRRQALVLPSRFGRWVPPDCRLRRTRREGGLLACAGHLRIPTRDDRHDVLGLFTGFLRQTSTYCPLYPDLGQCRPRPNARYA